ncbi:MAG: hypothetical protein SPI59_02790 [Finegoldia sp.]|nr:hypothetical protein [Finegoldia sp.]
MKNQKLRISKIINYAGAFIALLIGSGFATGQELMQFFASYGLIGIGSILLVLILLAFVGVQFVKYGNKYKFENPNDIYVHICGNKLGRFYDYFSVLFLFLSFTVMIAGAQATAVQHYNASSAIGGIVLGIAVILTVIMGLNRIVDVIGKIGPFIVVLAMVVGLLSMIKNWSNIGLAQGQLQALLSENKITQASSFGPIGSVLSYVGFCMLWLAAFCAGIGKNAEVYEEAKKGQVLGAIGFSLGTAMMSFAIFLSIGKVYDSQIPSLILAGEISPLLANIFSILIMLGIYTTAVPLLWNVTARFFKEGSSQFKVATLILGAIGIFIGLILKFDKLVNYVYVLNGYLGILLLIIMIIKAIKERGDTN